MRRIVWKKKRKNKVATLERWKMKKKRTSAWRGECKEEQKSAWRDVEKRKIAWEGEACGEEEKAVHGEAWRTETVAGGPSCSSQGAESIACSLALLGHFLIYVDECELGGSGVHAGRGERRMGLQRWG